MSVEFRVGPVNGAAFAAPATSIADVANESSAPLLPKSKVDQLMASGDVASMLAAMLIEAGEKSKEAARLSRDAALQAEEAASQRKIEHMEKAAEQKFLGGFASGLGVTAQGGLGITGAAVAKSDLGHDGWKGGGSASDGIGKMGGAYFNEMGAQEDKEVAQAERELTQAKRAVESASDDGKDAKDLLNKVLDHYKELTTAKEDAKRAALFRA
jgi:hypothetical protein